MRNPFHGISFWPGSRRSRIKLLHSCFWIVNKSMLISYTTKIKSRKSIYKMLDSKF